MVEGQSLEGMQSQEAAGEQERQAAVEVEEDIPVEAIPRGDHGEHGELMSTATVEMLIRAVGERVHTEVERTPVPEEISAEAGVQEEKDTPADLEEEAPARREEDDDDQPPPAQGSE